MHKISTRGKNKLKIGVVEKCKLAEILNDNLHKIASHIRCCML